VKRHLSSWSGSELCSAPNDQRLARQQSPLLSQRRATSGHSNLATRNARKPRTPRTTASGRRAITSCSRVWRLSRRRNAHPPGQERRIAFAASRSSASIGVALRLPMQIKCRYGEPGPSRHRGVDRTTVVGPITVVPQAPSWLCESDCRTDTAQLRLIGVSAAASRVIGLRARPPRGCRHDDEQGATTLTLR
jgi:hypothetical protein